MGLVLRSRNFAGLSKRFEMAKIFDHRLFRIATDECLPCAGQLPHTELLKHRDHRPSIAGSFFEDHLARVIRFAAD